ncbi:MAG: hypothetical protein JWM47_4049 [Acidimicrobiales bacterium]|nr:hypothetical protein [Acidimicrobiales bacterium]
MPCQSVDIVDGQGRIRIRMVCAIVSCNIMAYWNWESFSFSVLYTHQVHVGSLSGHGEPPGSPDGLKNYDSTQ